MGGDARKEFHARFDLAALEAQAAVHPDDPRRNHLPAVGQRFTAVAQPDVDIQRFALTNGRESRQFDPQARRADIFGLAAEITGRRRLVDLTGRCWRTRSPRRRSKDIASSSFARSTDSFIRSVPKHTSRKGQFQLDRSKGSYRNSSLRSWRKSLEDEARRGYQTPNKRGSSIMRHWSFSWRWPGSGAFPVAQKM